MGAEGLKRLGQELLELSSLVEALRAPNGCPWDREQTPETMRVYLMEEMHELVESIDAASSLGVREELGDVLFQVFFLARIFEERGLFSLADVANGAVAKMKARHPHVFGEASVKDAEEVRRRWHEFKAQAADKKKSQGPFDSIPKSLPALMRAYRVAERAGRVGLGPVPESAGGLQERWQDFQTKAAQKDEPGAQRALGEFLFAVALLAREAGVHPETALARAVNEFIAGSGPGA